MSSGKPLVGANNGEIRRNYAVASRVYGLLPLKHGAPEAVLRDAPDRLLSYSHIIHKIF